MSRTTFFERFDKANKFFDNGYHHHKATYKGLAQFFENYSDIEKTYANSLLKHAQKISSIPDFSKEQQYIKQGISEIGGNLQRVSQLHFNFGQRLHQIGEYCQQQYLQSKRQKQKIMKMLFEKAAQDHERVRYGGNREKLNEKQKQICKNIFDGLDGFLEDEVSRCQKLKEQCIIFFSLSKKIAQKKVELSSAYNIKLAQFQVHVKVPQLQEIEDGLVQQYNGYGQDQLFRKNREINKQIAVNRQSLRQSIVHRQKILKIQDYLSKLNKTIEKYKQIPQQLNYPNEDDYLVGIFDRRVLPLYKKFSRQFKSQSVKEIAYAWLWSFNNVTNNEENLSLLTVMKANLKVRHLQMSRTKSNAQFVSKFIQNSNQQNKKTIYFLIYLSQIYEGTLRMTELQQILKKKDVSNSSIAYEHLFHWKIYLVLVDYLLDSVIIVNDGYSILYDEYVDIFKLINTFAKEVFNLDSGIVMTVLLRKIQKVMQVTQSEDPEKLEQILEQKINYRQQFSLTEQLKMQMGHKLINFVSQNLCIFYKCKISFSNLIKMSLMIEKILPKNYFTAIENMHSCIKIAGFRFFQESDEDKKLLEGVWKGDQRLKNLTEVLEELQLENVYSSFLFPMAQQLSRLLGVGYQVIANKMKRQFSQPIFEIIQCNLQMLSEQEGHDKQGYILRLGICLSIIDLQQPQELDYYSLFFTILQNYLSSTEKDYDQLLQHARRTELWIVEENSQATQNCIDFCSLLYKPFQFLLISLKKLEAEQKQTQFTQKFSDFIKLKLNRALKSQIQKYVKFLFESLDKYCFKQPELTLKYKRLSSPILAGKQVLAKQGYNLREVTRRLFNLMFLKDQLDEIVCDFIEPQIYSEINSSIFNLQLLSKVANTHLNYQQILTNIYQIALLISQTNDKLVNKVADITVYHFMGRMFSNLYFQEQKGFFSSDKDYALSQFTFVKSQQQLEQLFLNITRNLPIEVIDGYSKQFCLSFCRAYRYQILDTNKFKIPIKQQKIIGYLQADLNFFCNLLKQKFMSAVLVKQFVEDPCLKILRDIEKNNQKLMESFSEATLKNNNDSAKYILAILNLKRDERAEQFVQKYKKILK